MSYYEAAECAVCTAQGNPTGRNVCRDSDGVDRCREHSRLADYCKRLRYGDAYGYMTRGEEQ